MNAAGKPGREDPNWAGIIALKSDLKRRFRHEGVIVIEQVLAFSPPFEFWIWLGTETDVQRDALRDESDLVERVARRAEKAGLHGLLEGVHVESQETVDRDYEGKWFYAMR